MKQSISRRTLLTYSIKGTAALAIASVVGKNLIGCKKNQSLDQPPINAKAQEASADQPPASLTEEQIAARKALNYTDTTPIASKPCDKCKLYTLPTNASSPYGGCKIVPGPIHPKGYCVAWIPQM